MPSDPFETTIGIDAKNAFARCGVLDVLHDLGYLSLGAEPEDLVPDRCESEFESRLLRWSPSRSPG
jgi:hypothetical protein